MLAWRTLAVIFTSTVETPARADTTSWAWPLKRSRTGQAGGVSSNVKPTSPNSEIRTSLIMPRLTTSRPRSGSMIWDSADRTCFSVGAGMASPIVRASGTALGRRPSAAPAGARDLDPLQLGAAGIQRQDADGAIAGEAGGGGCRDVDEAGAADRLVAPAVGVAVDTQVQLRRPRVAPARRPVDHADVQPLEAAPHLHRVARVVGRVAVDHGHGLAESPQPVQHRLLLPVAHVPHLVHRREAPGHKVQQG